MSRYCLDTSAYSRFMHGDPGALAVIDGAQWVGMPAIVLGELYAGFAAGARARENGGLLERFVANPVVEVLPVDHEIARIYADILQSLRQKGRSIPANDIWIAATASRAGAILLTAAAHFEAVDRIGVHQLRRDELNP